MLCIYWSAPDLRRLCKSAVYDELSCFSKHRQTWFALSKGASGPGTPWVTALETLKNNGCFQRFYSRRLRPKVLLQLGRQRERYPLNMILRALSEKNCAWVSGNRNGFNMNQKLICEFFLPPVPRSHTNTYRFSLFTTPLLSRRTRPLMMTFFLFFFILGYLHI